MKFIVTNFAYGTGPYLRTTDFAIRFNEALEERGRERFPIIVPLVYGERQKQVMHEEFSKHEERYPGEILLDPRLGEILRGIFYYGARTYEQALERWVNHHEEASQAAQKHLGGTFTVETMRGVERRVDGTHVAVELNRSPRLWLGVAPTYSTTFCYTSEILARVREVPPGTIAVRPELLENGILLADRIEADQGMRLLARPATFSWEPSYAPRHPSVLAPPIGSALFPPHREKITPGIYVTVTGIPGLERLYKEALSLGMTLYSNDPDAVPGSIRALPKILANPAIKLHVARSGWSSVWLSMFLGVPMVVPEFDRTDDPEIYFNNHAVETLGIGAVYREQSLTELLNRSEEVRSRQRTVSEEIRTKWGTIDGIEFCARRSAEDFIKKNG